MDVWDYFERRERECRNFGLAPSDTLPPQYREMEGSDGARGLMLARYEMSDTALIEIKEIIEVVDGSHVHRVQYAYYLVVDGAEEYARERDPSHDPPVHGHGPHHAREEAGPISFSEFVENCWGRVSDLAEQALGDQLASDR